MTDQTLQSLSSLGARADSMGARGGAGGGGGVQSNLLLTQNFYFLGKFRINLIHLGYRIYPNYSHPSNKSHFTICVKLLGEWQTVQTSTDAAFHVLLDLHCLSGRSV